MREEAFKAAYLAWMGEEWIDHDPVSVTETSVTGTKMVRDPDGYALLDFVFDGDSIRVERSSHVRL